MQFVNHAKLGHGLLSVHQAVFVGVEVKVTPDLAEKCWRASREEQQGRAGQLIHLLIKVQINGMHIFTPDFLGVFKALNGINDCNTQDFPISNIHLSYPVLDMICHPWLAQTCVAPSQLEQQQKKEQADVFPFSVDRSKAKCLESVCFWLRKGTEQLYKADCGGLLVAVQRSC